MWKLHYKGHAMLFGGLVCIKKLYNWANSPGLTCHVIVTVWRCSTKLMISVYKTSSILMRTWQEHCDIMHPDCDTTITCILLQKGPNDSLNTCYIWVAMEIRHPSISPASKVEYYINCQSLDIIRYTKKYLNQSL